MCASTLPPSLLCLCPYPPPLPAHSAWLLHPLSISHQPCIAASSPAWPLLCKDAGTVRLVPCWLTRAHTCITPAGPVGAALWTPLIPGSLCIASNISDVQSNNAISPWRLPSQGLPLSCCISQRWPSKGLPLLSSISQGRPSKGLPLSSSIAPQKLPPR